MDSLIGVAYLILTVYAANQVRIGVWQEAILRWLLYLGAGLMFMLGLTTLLAAQLSGMQVSPDLPPQPSISVAAAAAVLILALTAGTFSLSIVNSIEMRQRVKQVVGRWGAYDPESVVHTTAVMLICLIVTSLIVFFVINGGAEGYNQTVSESGIEAGDVLLEGAVQIIAGALGVGFIIRRTGREALERLGLTIPTAQKVIVGILAGVGLIIIVRIVSLFITPEQQNSSPEQIALALNTLPLALLVSISAGVSEEIFVRGALQPVFGVWITSTFFTLLHVQYFFTPVLLVIFGVSIALGFVRQRYDTTTAIIAHFTYNFVPLALAILEGGAVAS